MRSGNKMKGYERAKLLKGSMVGKPTVSKAAAIPFDCKTSGGLGYYMQEYLQGLRVKNYSERTVDSQREALVQFIVWLHERDISKPEQVTRQVLESYQRYLFNFRKPNGKPLGVGTQISKLSFIRGYFSWLCKKYYLVYNPASELEMPKEGKKLPQEPLSIEQVESVLSQPDIHDPLGVRDRAILEVLYSTGMRRAELSSLKLVDFNRDRETFQIRSGKGNRDRVVPVGDRALSWVEKYIDENRPLLLLDADEESLFVSAHGVAFQPGSLGQTVRRYIKEAEIGRAGGCHLFRHSCATHMLENGCDIRMIQKLLGHSKLETTQVYTEVSIKKLQEVHRRTHPAKKYT